MQNAFSSALAHVLLGQFKTAIIMILASILFGSKFSAIQLLAAAGAVVAIVVYSQITLNEKNMETEEKTKETLPEERPFVKNRTTLSPYT